MTRVLLYILPLCVCFITACSTEPDFERLNVKDPGSPSFSSGVSNLTLEFNSKNQVLLNWSDNSEFETTFVISKSINSDSSFIPIDTISANATSYLDTSRNLAPESYYMVTGISEETDLTKSSGISAKLNFGSIGGIDFTGTDNFGNITWDNTNISADRFLIEKRTNQSWVELGTISANETELMFEELSEVYLVDIKITALFRNSFDNYFAVDSSVIHENPVNHPSNLNVVITSEATAVFTWDDNTSFVEDFILLQRREAPAGMSPESYYEIDTVSASNTEVYLLHQPNSEYEFSIKPIRNGVTGKPILPVSKTINVSKPTITDFATISNTEILLEWEDNNIGNSNLSTYHFYLDVTNTQTGQKTVTILDRNATQHNITSLDPGEIYSIGLRTYSSSYSLLVVEYETGFEQVKHFELSQSPHFQLQTTYGEALIVVGLGIGGGMTRVAFLNPSDGKLEREIEFPSYFDKFSLSKDNNLIAISYLEENELKVYDISGANPNLINSSTEYSIAQFINDSTLLIGDGDRFVLWNVFHDSVSYINLTNRLENYIIEDVYPSNGSHYYFMSEHSRLGKIKHWRIDLSTEEILQHDTYDTIFGETNDQNQSLIIDDTTVHLIKEDGSTGATYPYPISNTQKVIRAVFFLDDYVVTSTNRGYVHLYNKHSGQYISSVYYPEPIPLYSLIRNLTAINSTETIMFTNFHKQSYFLKLKTRWIKSYQ